MIQVPNRRNLNNIVYISIILIISCIPAIAQNANDHWKVNIANDHFWEPNCPLMDGFSLWLLRQKLTLDGYQTIIDNENDVENGKTNKIKLTAYFPLLKEGSFNSMVGLRYGKYDIPVSDDSKLKRSLQQVWLWSALQYKYNRWNINLTTESYYTGDQNSLYEKIGNRFFSILYFGYEINNEWAVILMGGYDSIQLEGEESNKPIVAIEARYQPTENFKMLFGVPILLAAEWTALQNTDIGMKTFITSDSQFFIRQRLSKIFGISMQYNCDWNKSLNTYFNSVTIPGSSDQMSKYNNISFLQHQMSLNFEFRLSHELGLNLGVGKNFSSNFNLYYNKEKITDDFKSRENIFAIINLQYLNFKVIT